MGAASLYSVFASKGFDGVPGAILGCDVVALSPAPFGNLVRVSFDRDYPCAGRDAAKQIGVKFLPICEGFRHFVVESGMGTFVVGLVPNDYGDDDLIVSQLHTLRPFVAGCGFGSRRDPASGAKGRPAIEVAA